MSDPREEQRAWLRDVLSKTGLSPGALAKKAGLAPPTLTVFLNNAATKHALSARTIASITEATGLRFGPAPRVGSPREPESAPFQSRTGEEGQMVRAVVGDSNSITAYRLESRALECAGFQPGDTMIVDLNAGPQPGDVVCAQIYDYARALADTVFRVYEPPYLVSATFDARLRRPLVLDKHLVDIKGVVVASLRARQARAA